LISCSNYRMQRYIFKQKSPKFPYSHGIAPDRRIQLAAGCSEDRRREHLLGHYLTDFAGQAQRLAGG